MYGLRNSQSTPNTVNPTTLGIEAPERSDLRGVHLPIRLARPSLSGVELELLLPFPGLPQRRIHRLDVEAVLLLDDLAILVRDGDVRVVRNVVGQCVPEVPRLAENVRLDV